MRLKDKAAIVTGSGHGLGRAIAEAFADQGANVALFSRSEADLNDVARSIDARGGKSLVVAGDVSKEEDVALLVRRTIERFGTVDILVNNAAIIGPPRFLDDTDAQQWLETININLNGLFYCCRAVLPTMVKQRAGKIINVTSGLGSRPYARFCAYGVSKAGANQLTRFLAEEFSEANIQVNAMDPGVMDTPMQEKIRGEGAEKLGQEIFHRFKSLKEHGELRDPARVAQLAVYLASSESNHINGRIMSLSDLP
jgi:3-oxoacyl-[acyl-carrier protein] reductase